MIRKHSYFLLLLTIAIIAGCGTSEKSQSQNKEEENEVRNLQLGDSEEPDMTASKSAKSTFHDAMKQKLIDNKEKAIELFKKAIKNDPKLANAHYQIAEIYEEQKEYGEASYYAEKAAKLEPDNKFYQLLYSRILTYHQKYDKAASILEKQLKKDAQDRQLYLKLAMIYELKGDYKKSIETYNRLERIAGVNEQISMAKKGLYLKMDDIGSAAGEIQKLIDENPGEMQYYHQLAEMYRANNKKEKALEVYEKMIARDPDNPVASFSLASYYLDEGDEDKFRSYIKKAFISREINIENKAQFLFNYARQNRGSQEKEQFALEMADWMIEAHSDSAIPYATKGQLLNMQGRSGEALDLYEQALERDESNFAIWQDAMMLAVRQQKYARLETIAEDAASVFPNQPFPYYMRGVAYSMQDKNEQAENVLNRALIIGSGNQSLKAEVYSSLGDLYHKMEKHALSDSMYDESLAINPSNAYVLNNYAYYLSLRDKNLEKAEEMARKANQIEPRNSSFEDTYGWVLYKLGNYESAAEWLERAMNHTGSESGTILEHYGDVQFKLGNKETAVEYWEKARKYGDTSDNLERKIAEKKLYE